MTKRRLVTKQLARTITSGLLLFCGANLAFADGALDETSRFEIVEQPLDQALLAFSEQADIQIVMAADTTRDLPSSGVHGERQNRDVLEQLLDDSGLAYTEHHNRTVAVHQGTMAVEDESGQPGNLPTTPGAMLIIQASGNQTTTSQSSRQNDSATSVVSGKVTDARSGANLKGALVTIEETGQTTSTDNLGRFRFAALPRGTYTIAVSYLGYVGQSATAPLFGQPFQQDFALRGGTELEEIVVFGTRSARAQALNQERTAPNSQSVINADLLGNFNGTTISEALRRAPGIAFVPDTQTGQGAQVIVRGLEPDLNEVALNGQPILDGTGIGRSPDLSNILTENIESVTINYSLLPSQASNGAGALIEIETKSPLDRGKRFASFNAEYGDTKGDFGDEFQFGGTLSGVFGGSDDLGLSLSAAYREREADRLNVRWTTEFGDFLPLDLEGNPIRFASQLDDELDPRLAYPFGEGSDVVYPGSLTPGRGTVNTEVLTVNGTMEKQLGSHTNLRLDIDYNEEVIRSYSEGLSVAASSNYDLTPVDILEGEERYVWVSEDPGRNRGLTFLFGDGIPGFVLRNARYSPGDKTARTGFSFRGDTTSELWSFEYSLGHSLSETSKDTSFRIETERANFGNNGNLPVFEESIGRLIPRELLQPAALSNMTSDGRIVSVFSPLSPGSDAIPLPLFTQEGFAFYNDPKNIGLDRIVVDGPTAGEGEATTAGASARRSFSGGLLSYVEAGVDYRDSTFAGRDSQAIEARRLFESAAALSITDLGLDFGPGLLTAVGAPVGFDAITERSALGLFSSIDSLAANGVLVDIGEREADETFDLRTAEETTTGYIEAAAQFGRLEVIGGVRVEHIDISATAFAAPNIIDGSSGSPRRVELPGQIVTDGASQTSFLPRVSANYRFNDNLMIRGAYFVTESRPRLNNITDRRTISAVLSLPQFPSSVSVFQGNPDLDPARSHSFDLSIERYGNDQSVYKAAIFHKRIENPLRTFFIDGGLDILPEGVVLPDIDVLNQVLNAELLDVVYSVPVNGEEADEIWGYTITVEQPLKFLPNAFDGLGIYLNYTFTDSSSEREFRVNETIDPSGFVLVDDVPFDSSPEQQGTIGLTYTNVGFDASLLYSAQERRLTSYEPFLFHRFNESVDSLDLHASYSVEVSGRDVRFFVIGRDLLRDEGAAQLQTSRGGTDGVPRYYDSLTFFGGRTITFGASVVF